MKAKVNRNVSILRTMACAENQNFATRRLLKDFKQIQNNKIPTVNISCVPLEDDLFVWHGNLIGTQGTDYEGAVFHFELTFPENYPAAPPAVRLFSEIKHPNVFDGSVCLDMLNSQLDKNGVGWTPAYSIESVLIQLQSFLFYTVQRPATEKEKIKLEHQLEKLRKKANEFECETCSHRGKINAYPPTKEASQVDPAEYAPKLSMVELFEESLQCFHSKLSYKECPLGLGLNIERVARTGNMHYCNPASDLISLKAFNKQGVRKSSRNEKFGFWLPLYLSTDQRSQTLHLAKKSLSFIKTNNSKRFSIDMVEEILLKIMASIVIKTADLKTHASCAVIQLLVFVHALALLFVKEYPEILTSIDQKLQDFIENEESRSKEKVPYLIYILMYLLVSEKYSFEDLVEKYSEEQLDRQVFWILQKIPELGKNENFIIEGSIEEVAFKSQAVSYSIVMVCKHYYSEMRRQYGSWANLLAYLEAHKCKLPNSLEDLLQRKFKYCIEQVDSFELYYSQVGLKPKNKEELTDALKKAKANSLRKKYHGAEEELNRIPSHPEQIKALPMRRQTLTDFIRDKRLVEADEAVWKQRSLDRWSFVRRFAQIDVRREVTPAMIAKAVDAKKLPLGDSLYNDVQDLKVFYDQIFSLDLAHRSVDLDLYPADYSWKEMYLKLDLEEDLLLLNLSEELSGFYAKLEAAADHLKVLKLYIVPAENIKSKHHYLTKVLSLLPRLTSLTIQSHLSSSLVTNKMLASLLKGFTRFSENHGRLSHLTLKDFVANTEDNDTSNMIIKLFELWGDVAAVSFDNSNVLNVKRGELICNFVIQNDQLVQLHFINSIKSDKVAGYIADGLMRNKKLAKLVISRATDCQASAANIVYNLAFNPNFKVLHMSTCTIGNFEVFVDKLQKLLSINGSLEQLVLPDMASLASKLSVDFFKSLGSNPSLRLLDLGQDVAPSLLATPDVLATAVAVNAHRRGKLAELYLQGCLDYSGLNKFADNMYYTKNLVDLWYGSNLSSAAQSTVGQAELEKHYLCQLKVLSVARTPFANDFVTSHWTKLKNNYLLRKNHSMPAFFRLFTYCAGLEKLDLARCSLGPQTLEGVSFVLENGYFQGKDTIKAVEQLSLTQLDLSFNPLQKTGAKVLSSLSKNLPALTILNLNHCRLGVSGATSLSKSELFGRLEALNLFCNRIDVDGARALSAALVVNKSLRILDIGYNRIKDEGLNQIGAGLQQATGSALHYLNVRFNLCSFTAFERFLDRIAQAQVQVLLVKRNEIEDFYLKEIAEKMRKVPSLRFIDQLQKLDLFNEDRTSRSVWLPSYSESQRPAIIAALKKVDPNICILSISARTPRVYPNKPKAATFGYVELAHANAAAKVMRHVVRDKKKKLSLKVVMGKAKLAGTGRFYFNKRTQERQSLTNKFKVRAAPVRAAVPAATTLPSSLFTSMPPMLNVVEGVARPVAAVSVRGGRVFPRGLPRGGFRGGRGTEARRRSRSPIRRRDRSSSSESSVSRQN